MLNKLDIANLALGKIGSTLSITDFSSDRSVQAQVIRRHFKTCLEDLLEMHEWNFAKKTAPLTLISEDPEDTFRYLYQVPSDCLVIREIGRKGFLARKFQYEDEKIRWEQIYTPQGARIRSNLADAVAVYTINISEDFNFPNHFGRALYHHLALEIAPSIITNNYLKVKNNLMTDVKNEISRGIANDLGREPLRGDPLTPFQRARWE